MVGLLCLLMSCGSDEPKSKTLDYETITNHTEWSAEIYQVVDGIETQFYCILTLSKHAMELAYYNPDGTPASLKTTGAVCTIHWDKRYIDAHFPYGLEQWYFIETDEHLPGMSNEWQIVLVGPQQYDIFYPGNIFKK